MITLWSMSPQAIRSVRERARLPQAEFGTILGVKQSLVSHWENGAREPTPLQEAAILKMKERLDRAQRDYNLRSALLGFGSISAIAFLSWLEGREPPPDH